MLIIWWQTCKSGRGPKHTDLPEMRSFDIIRTRILSQIMTWWRHQMDTSPRYWPFMREIHWSPMNSLHKGQWRGVFSLICYRINGLVNKREAGDLWRHRIHFDVIVVINYVSANETRRCISNVVFDWSHIQWKAKPEHSPSPCCVSGCD